jgi:glycosyltransferase involved in cell wall biosynthesis
MRLGYNDMLSIIIPTVINPEGFDSVLCNVPLDSQLIVVDNSDDGYADFVTVRPETVYLPQSANLKVNASWNLAASYAEGDILLFLNDDIVFKDTEALPALARAVRTSGGWAHANTVTKFYDSTTEPATVRTPTREGWCFGMLRRLFQPIPGGEDMPVNFYGDDWLFNLCVPNTVKALSCQITHEQGVSSSRIRRTQSMGDEQDGARAVKSGIVNTGQ